MKTIGISTRNVSVGRPGGRYGLGILALGAALAFALSAPAATRYVNVNNPTPQSPYDTFATAATRIQDVIDISYAGDLILVTNGVYRTGGRAVYRFDVLLTNRVTVWSYLTVQSMELPGGDFIKG